MPSIKLGGDKGCGLSRGKITAKPFLTGGDSLGQEPPRKASRERPHFRGRPEWGTANCPVADWVSLEPVLEVLELDLGRGHGTLERRIPYSPLAVGLRPIPLWPAGTKRLESSQMTRPGVRGAPGSWAPGPAGLEPGVTRWSGAARGSPANGGEGARGGTRGTGRARGWVQMLRLCSKLLRGHWLEGRSHTLRKGRRCTLELGHSWVTQSREVAESEVAPETAGEVHSY